MELSTARLGQKRPFPSPARQKILYLQPGTQSFAGIERVVDTICCKLAEKYADDFEVDVLYTSAHVNRPSDRNYHAIDRRPRGRLQLMNTFRDVIKSKDYDLIVVPQIEPAVIAMVSCLGIRRNFVVHLHGNPKRECSHLKAKILFFLMKAFFLERASYIFGTSPRQLASFREMFGNKVPLYWVPNPVRRFDGVEKISGGEPGCVTFVNVGRFSYQKGQDILVRAFAKVYKQRKNARLKIVGHGAGEAELRQQIDQLQLRNVVTIEHHPDNPQPALSASDIYVSTSRWEGWSLAICEALRFGLPVISTDCEFGPSDILVDERLGRLVDAEGGASLVAAMVYYCDHLTDEKANADFRKSFIDQYSDDLVVDVHASALRAAAR
ncbi:alpha-mannosyltransferase [Rhizobium sp. R72]|uniref:glycosyltransferase n=1 Tax=unclassified Rhizobium TaxID=2613769 RepID=UPI000B532563|nr:MULTISPECIES: glycosyltransferase [unclassified Rhizobium]OWV96116.1 alpha-mannosyltransferase [Rhizobium sp. R72]OWV96600.1 alpha-mannosyltransferase [Rhizobium sp. R711]